MRKSLLIILLFFSVFYAKAQTLAAGDIIFTAFDSNPAASADKFSFILLADLQPGTIIYFTDRGYFGSSNWQADNGGSETTIRWTTGASVLLKGTEVTITSLTASTGTVVSMSSSANGLSLSNVGDQIIAFQGSSGNPASATGMIAGLHWFYCTVSPNTTTSGWDEGACGTGPNFSRIPSGLTGGTNAFQISTMNTVYTQGAFNGTGLPAANVAAVRTAIMNPANWTKLTSTTSGVTIPTGFTFLGAPAPSISSQPSNSTICATANTTFTMAASNATSYQWQLSTNAGANFNNITNGAPYYGATTATLTVTAATSGMNGYQYRCVATGTTSPAATTNAATLTVNPVPSITTQPSNKSIVSGANTTFTVAASNATGYQWQVDNGVGFASISNGGVYSGVTTATLTITGATAGMNNYAYRCVATGSCSPSAPSNGALLTVSSGSSAVLETFPNIANNAAAFTNGVSGMKYTFTGSLHGTIYAALGHNADDYIVSNDGNCLGAAGTVGSIKSATAGYMKIKSLWVFPSTDCNVVSNGGASGAVTFIGRKSGVDVYTVTLPSASINTLQSNNQGFTLVDFTSTANGNSDVSNIEIDEIKVNVAGTLRYAAIDDISYTFSPLTQATNVSFASTTGTTTTASWTNGTGTGRIVFMKQASSGNATPVNNTTYNANTAFGSGSQISSTGWFCVYKGTGTSVNITGLTGNTSYQLMVVEYNGAAASEQYMTSPASNNPGTVTTTSSGVLLSSSPTLTFGSSTGMSTMAVDGNGGSATINDLDLQIFAGDKTSGIYTASTTMRWENATYLASGNGFNGVTPGPDPAITNSGFSALIIKSASQSANFSLKSIKLQDWGAVGPIRIAGYNDGTLVNYVTVSLPTNGDGVIKTQSDDLTSAYFNNIDEVRIYGASATAIWVAVNDIQVGSPVATPAPVITGNPPNRTICNGSNTTFTITATGATNYKWQENSGSGFVDILAGAPFSNITTATLTITGATPAMSGFQYRCVATNANGSTTSSAGTLTIDVVSGTGSATAVSCFGGSNGTATVTPTSGIAPYTYSWSPSGGTAATATGLTAGTYTVTITDNIGCTGTVTVVVGQPAAALSATASVVLVSCNGGSNGSATINATGGTAPYSYLWSTGATTQTISGLVAGYYTYIVTDANGCSKSYNGAVASPNAGAVVTQPSVLNATGAWTNVACFGGSNGVAAISASGGTPGYTYLWSNGATTSAITGLTAGSYTVTVTDANGCQKQRTIVISQPASALSATITSQTNNTAFGGTSGAATVSASGGTAGYTYSWSPSGGTAATATGLAAGTYTVTIEDVNGCTTTASVTITQPTLVVFAQSQTNILCNGGATGSATVGVSVGTGPYTYSWSPSGGTAATATGLMAGNYTVTVTGTSGTTTQSFTITQPSALIATAGAQTNVSCNGGGNGSATVNVTGGTGAYTYSWAPSGGTTATASGLSAGTYTVTVKDANLCQTTQSFTITQPVALVSSVGSQTNVSCNGGSNGSATVTVTGGTGAYTYSWAPSGGTSATASGLSAGTYTVTVTDANNCTSTQSFTITQPAVLVATASSQTNILCNGGTTGSATVAVTGGTGAYTYSWAPSGGTGATASGLAAGTYTVTVKDANLCQTTQSFTITQPSALVATASAQTNILCNGGATGSATVAVTGGTGAYTYSWAPSGGTAATASGLAAGTYTVTVKDANLCQTTQSFTITQPSALIATVGAQTNVSCNGGSNGSATVAVTGGTGAYTYSWAPSGGTSATASGLAAGTYTVTIKDANLCQTTQSFTITQPSALIATTGAQTNVSCNGGSNGSATVAVTGGTGAYTYSWAPSGGTAATASGLSAGTYTVTITDANGCTTTQSFTITQPSVLIASASAQTNILCNGGSSGSATVAVTGGTGAYTYSWAPSGGTAATASGLSAGTYTVTVTDAYGCTTTQSFTITQPPVLIASASTQTNILCNGGATGSATVAVTGGTGAYTYSWAPSGGTSATASGLAAGTYTVTVKDANLCQTTQSFTITQPSALIATVGAQANVSCNGGSNGSATVTVTGGTGAYTYSWAPSGGTAATASGLSAGTYTVTVTDANLCQTTQSFTITQPSALVATTGAQTNVSCNGGNNGSATVTVTGGTGAYTYSWAPSGGTAATASGLSAGTYTVTVTDANSCSTTQSFTITQPSAVLLAAGTLAPATVNIAYAQTFAATGASGTYTYVLATGALPGGLTLAADGTLSGTPTTAGNFSFGIKATDQTCTGVSATASFSLSIAKGSQLITFGTIPNKVYEDADFSLGSGLTSTGHTITYTAADPSVVSITGNMAHILKAGITVITASQAGDANYNAAVPVDRTLTIAKHDQSITFNTIPNKVYEDVPFSLMATGGNSGNVVTYSSSNTAVATISGSTVTIVGAGMTTITASQAGNVNYNAAPGVDRILTVAKKSQTIIFAAITNNKNYGDAPFGLSSTGGSSGNVVTYSSSNTAVATISGATVTIVGVGTATITANQAGNGNYEAAAAVTRPLTVVKRLVTVVANGMTKTYGSPDTEIGYTFSPPLLGGDVFSGTLDRVAGEAVGSYAITLGSLSVTGNYEINLRPATARIVPRPVTVSASAKTKTYGSADPALTYTTSGDLLPGDSFSGSLSRTAGENAGSYAISQGTVAIGPNYSISFVGNDLTINKKGLTIRADDKSKLAGTANPVLTASYVGFVIGETSAVLGSQPILSTTALLNSPAGSYDITAAGAMAQNYDISYQKGTLTVVQVAVADITLATVQLLENRPAGTNVGTLNSSSTNPDPGYTYSYSLVGGTGATDNALFVVSGSSLNTAAPLDYENRSSYSIRLRSTDQNGQSLEKVFTISLTDVNEAPVMDAVANTTICTTTAEQTVALTGISAGPETAQTTTLGVSSNNAALFGSLTVAKNGGNAGTLSYRLATGAVGTATVTVTINDNGGTANGGTDSFTRTFTITANALPTAAISSSKGLSVAKGEVVVLTATGGTSYSWAAADGIVSGQGTAALTVRPTATTTYTVTVTNASGCTDTKNITIAVTEEVVQIKATNIMSPNGDGVNDKWVIENIDLYPNNEVKIFDRAGRLIYSKKKYDNSWDATLNGLPLAEGTYYYIFNFGNGNPEKKGFITILNKN